MKDSTLHYPSNQSIRLLPDNPCFTEYYIDGLKLLGFINVSTMEHGDVCRSDALLVLFYASYPEEVIESHPYNPVIIVGKNHFNDWLNERISWVDDYTQLTKVLKVAEPPKKPDEPINHSDRLEGPRTVYKKLRCVYCAEMIGNTYLGLKKHQEACVKRPSRVVTGRMVSIRQPSGRTKGSYLVVHLPESIELNGKLLEPGIQIIIDPKIIKGLNALLARLYKYELIREDREEKLLG